MYFLPIFAFGTSMITCLSDSETVFSKETSLSKVIVSFDFEEAKEKPRS